MGKPGFLSTWAVSAVCGLGLLALPLAEGASAPDKKNRVSLNSHVGFNIKASFSNLGGLPAPTDPGPAIGGVDHYYDNGYNLVDSSGNAANSTWNWGYDNSAQLVGNDTIVMTSTGSSATGSIADFTDDPQWGGELSYAHGLGWSGKYWWGLDVGFSWTDLSFNEDVSHSAEVTRITDSYALGSLIVPQAPYAGTYAGPGPVIGDTPTRTTQTIGGGARNTGTYDLDAQMYALRLGLLYETPFSDRFLLQFGGGAVGALVDSRFDYSQTVSITSSGATYSQSGSGSDQAAVGGVYALAGFTWRVTEAVNVNLAGQYNYVSEFTQTVDGVEAKLDFSKSIYVAVGVGFSF